MMQVQDTTIMIMCMLYVVIGLGSWLLLLSLLLKAEAEKMKSKSKSKKVRPFLDYFYFSKVKYISNVFLESNGTCYIIIHFYGTSVAFFVVLISLLLLVLP